MGWVSGERRTIEETAEAVPRCSASSPYPSLGEESNHQRRFVDAR